MGVYEYNIYNTITLYPIVLCKIGLRQAIWSFLQVHLILTRLNHSRRSLRHFCIQLLQTQTNSPGIATRGGHCLGEQEHTEDRIGHN